MKLKVRVIPNAGTTAFSGSRGEERVLRVQAPAVDDKANRAAVRFIAERLGLRASAVTLVSGEKSRHKIFEIVGLGACDVERRLAGTGPQDR
jgi:uncharacterized protein (TIGR00251 family)